ncbi:MAG: DUF3137 domain-containing protein [Aureispira sp.]|nr:DUF3137 domain-containing protein [Aureispira sp.]
MQDIRGFRRYYNEVLHNQLLEFEKERKKLVAIIMVACGILTVLSAFVAALDVFALTIFLVVPWMVLFQLLRNKAKQFKDRFKPLVVSSVLQFIDPRLKYYHTEYIPKDSFNRSGIFPLDPELYTGEDYIRGQIGEVSFEMCELDVHNTSDTKGKLEQIFEGIFFHANFNTAFKGRIVMIPRPEWQSFIRTMKNFTKYGGYELVDTGHKEFDQEFIVYLDKGVHYKDILTNQLIETINTYHLQSGKQVYAAFKDNHFYMAIDEPYELLEARIFLPNINFEMISGFYEELFLFTRIVEDFDFMH